MKKAAFIITACILSACGVHKKQFTTTIYEQVTPKDPTPVTVSYTIPSVIPTGKTQQTQTKGGVTISVEIEPFTVSNRRKESRTVAVADPARQGFDRYEVSSAPEFSVSPDRVKFKIRIRNNEQVPLVLAGIWFVLILDGVQYSFPKEQIEEWNKGMVVSGFEKTYEIQGPQVSELKNGQTVYLFLNGVPVSYNTAGAVTKKSNFEWYFSCTSEEKTVKDNITYRYDFTPVHKEQCASCSGKGFTTSTMTCAGCSGSGRIYTDGKAYSCVSCSGSGKRTIKHSCKNCSATGSKSYPKSSMPRVVDSETWTGWNVRIQTVPSGLPVRILDVQRKEYVNAGTSSCVVSWFNSSKRNYPILVEYNGTETKIMPTKPSGKPSKSVTIDFTGGSPLITGGTAVQ